MGISNDITERKQMEEALAKSEEKYKIHNKGIWVIDPESVTTFVNPEDGGDPWVYY